MPDPSWNFQYSFSQTPEQNGFTRELSGSPILTLVQTGPTSNRRVTVDSTAGDVVFVVSNVPTLDLSKGATLEFMVSVSGAGDTGAELTFLDAAVLIEVHSNSLRLTAPADGFDSLDVTLPTAANSTDTLFRLTVDSSRRLRVYRGGVSVGDPEGYPVPVVAKPFQRVLWWVESGAISTVKRIVAYYGGAIAPG